MKDKFHVSSSEDSLCRGQNKVAGITFRPYTFPHVVSLLIYHFDRKLVRNFFNLAEGHPLLRRDTK